MCCLTKSLLLIRDLSTGFPESKEKTESMEFMLASENKPLEAAGNCDGGLGGIDWADSWCWPCSMEGDWVA